MKRHVVFLARGTVAVASFLWTSIAVAQPAARVELAYERPAEADACRDARWMRDTLASQLGYDLFATDGPEVATLRTEGVTHIRVTVLPVGGLLRVRVTFEGPDGVARTTRQPPLHVSRDRCDELVRFAASAITAHVATPATTDTSPVVPPTEPSPPAPPALPPPRVIEAPVVDPARPDRWEIGVSVGGGATIGSSPGITPSLRAGAWLGRARWRVRAEVQHDFSTRLTDPQGHEVAVAQTLASLAGCGRWGHLQGCGVAQAGATAYDGGPVEYSGSLPMIALGLRALGEWPVASRISLWIAGEVLFPIVGASLQTQLRQRDETTLERRESWRPSPVAGGAHAGIAARLW
jgi:hypothetical protein